MPILGPLGPPQTTTEEAEKRDPSENPGIAEAERPRRPISDGDSDATLVSETTKQGVPAVHADNQENASQQTDVVMEYSENDAPETTNNGDMPPLGPADGPIAPPSQPPPVPPRPTPQVDPQKQLIEEVEIGAQQDVTEVINNVLFQSQCAIRPIGIASDGEQLDQIKEYVPIFVKTIDILLTIPQLILRTDQILSLYGEERQVKRGMVVRYQSRRRHRIP